MKKLFFTMMEFAQNDFVKLMRSLCQRHEKKIIRMEGNNQ